MELNQERCAVENLDAQVIELLINHFNYSIRDINSYDELTKAEKEMCSKELFELITKK